MIVLDTHVWLWWLAPDLGGLSAALRDQLASADDLAISTISIYELGIAVQRGRVHLALPFGEWLADALEPSWVRAVAPNRAIASRAAALPMIHGDPLDRLIIATALHFDAQLASFDTSYPNYPELAGRLIGK